MRDQLQYHLAAFSRLLAEPIPDDLPASRAWLDGVIYGLKVAIAVLEEEEE